jgi:hypothetical protein
MNVIVIVVLIKNLSLSFVLNQLNAAYIIICYFSKIHFIVILLFMLRF